MTTKLHHRGPDGKNTWHDSGAPFCTGHTRLSIIDLSPSGAQPMMSADGRFVISYNGEIYNFRSLRRELESTGVAFKSTSDTEVLLEAFATWGVEKTLGRIRGMFAIALWKSEEKELLLVRDRFGKKPIYYGWVSGAFVFASELKAIGAMPEFMHRVDKEAARLYFNFGFVPGNRSIFRDIYRLPPGCVVKISNRASSGQLPEPARYWRAEDVVQNGVTVRHEQDPEAGLGQVHDQLSEAVRLRMVADVPLGMLLSGGIDSSLVAALMQKYSDQPVKTFSVGFGESEYDEAKFARQIANHLGTEHTEVRVTPQDAMSVIPKLPTMYDEPFADSSQIPTYLISEVARRSVTVAMSGDGGDEVFGGYTRYVGGMQMWRALKRAPGPLRVALSRILFALSPALLDRTYGVISSVLPQSLRQRRPGELLHKLARVLSSNDLETFYERLTATGDALHMPGATRDLPMLTFNTPGTFKLDDRDWLMAADTALYLPDDILTKVDRASMSVSLEVRSPLLDQELFEVAWRLPQSLKFREGVGKWCLRQLLYQYVPRELMQHPKSGFAVPITAWLRGPLRDWAESLISRDKLADTGIEALNGMEGSDGIMSLWMEHLLGRRNREPELWSILMYQAWHETWVC